MAKNLIDIEPYQTEAGMIYEGATDKIGKYTILWELSKNRKNATTVEKVFSCQADTPNENGEYSTFELSVEKKTLKKGNVYKLTKLRMY